MENTVQLSLERYEELRAIERDFKKEVNLKLEEYRSSKEYNSLIANSFAKMRVDEYVEQYESEKKAHKLTKTKLIIAAILLIGYIISQTVEYV